MSKTLTVEGDITAVDTRTLLTTQGSVTAPSLVVPSGMTKIVKILVAAAAEGLDDDVLARLEALDAFAELHDFAGELMAGGDVGQDGEGAVVEVEVGSADAAGADAEEDLAGAGGRDRDGADLDALFSGAEGGGHLGHVGGIVALPAPAPIANLQTCEPANRPRSAGLLVWRFGDAKGLEAGVSS